jgi:hypothetical protein
MTGRQRGAERDKHMPWSTFLRAHWECLVATDFLTVEVCTIKGLVTGDAAGAHSWSHDRRICPRACPKNHKKITLGMSRTPADGVLIFMGSSHFTDRFCGRQSPSAGSGVTLEGMDDGGHIGLMAKDGITRVLDLQEEL